MTATKRSYCCICTRPMGYLWTGSRKAFPDYYCGTCYETYICVDGVPIPDDQLPKWIVMCRNREANRRMRTLYWERRGYTFEPIPLSNFRSSRDPQETDAEFLESMGKIIGIEDL